MGSAKGNSRYKLLGVRTIYSEMTSSQKLRVRQWKALRDIPEFAVKKGDKTGWIGEDLRPNENLIWVTSDSVVYGRVKMGNNTLVSGNSKVFGPNTNESLPGEGLEIGENCQILNHSFIGIGFSNDDYTSATKGPFIIDDNVRISHSNISLPSEISGDVSIAEATIGIGAVLVGTIRLECCTIGKEANFDGKITVNGSSAIGMNVSFLGDVEISDESQIGDNATLSHSVIVTGNSGVGMSAVIEGPILIEDESVVPKSSVIKEGKIVNDGKFPRDDVSYVNYKEIAATPTRASIAVAPAQHVANHENRWVKKFEDVNARIDAYESDIVKIIKYPTMTDLTNNFTSEMIYARNEAADALDAGGQDGFADLVKILEHKFLIAESHARKIATTHLTDAERKKTADAKDLFAIACNEASSEQEKKVSFKQGFARLEGIVSVPEKAIIAMQHKVGLAEIEM